MKKLYLRCISGFIYISIILLSLYTSEYFFGICLFIFSSICLWEFQKLLKYKSIISFIILTILFSSKLFFNLPAPIFNVLLILNLITNTFLLLWLIFSFKLVFSKSTSHFLSIFYISFSCFFIFNLGFLEQGFSPFYILYSYILIWINNSFAYLIGKKFGKYKLWKKVSKNKTWEGLLGGTLFCLITNLLFYYFFSIYSLRDVIIITFLTVPLISLGDLVQSKFKRKANIKNSGFWFPGHGGFYDRMDSIIFTAPFLNLIFLFL